jgi:hypothetical protein
VAAGTFVVNTTTTSASYTATLTAGKTYKWNVAAGDSAGESSFTTVLYFQTPASTPTISSVSPTSMPSSSADQSFIVYGNNFLSTSTLTFVDPQGDVYNSVAAKLTFVSSGQLDYQFNNGSDPGTWTVKVNNGGSSSGTASFTVTNVPATPSIASVSPTSMPSSSADQSFIVYGNNFLSTSTLTFVDPQGDVYNSVAAKLTFVSSGQLDYQLNNGSDPGTWTVKVNNGSLSSGTASFTVTNGTSSTLQGIDYRDYGVSATTGVNIPGITNAGKQFVCEYIGTADNDGYLRPSDVMALTNQGLQIVSIFERTPTSASYFTMANADYDATVSINAAIEAGQPSGSAIYFTVDYQVSSADFSAIDSYFQEIRKDFNQYFAAHPGINYKIGVYAPGNVLPTLMGDASVGASYSWLAEPWGIYSYSSENLAQTQDGVMIGGINADLDEAYTADFGQWGTSSSPTAQPVFGGLSITGGQLQTTLSGLVSGQTVIVYGSTDLKNWTPVKTNTVTGSTMTFTNTINPAIQAEYFRAQAQQ